jgi:D-psicose/D-tagatose/L-ribulose 3-epimerase
MKLAVSNIGWEQHDDPNTLTQLQQLGVKGIEVAPTKIWPGWKGANHKSATAYKSKMAELGFKLPAMQAILFGRPDLQLFDCSSHKKFFEHFKLLSEIASGLGSKVLVFGAPKNRKRNQTPYSEATEIAAEFFTKAAEICSQNNCLIGLEHNPVEYGCDFITNMHDAKQLVKQVDHRGLKLHLDSAGLHMCGGDISELIQLAGDFEHYHISEPMLEPICNSEVNHADAFTALKKIDYRHWVSIEMKQPKTTSIFFSSVKLANSKLQQANS